MIGLGEPREVRAGVVGGSYFDGDGAASGAGTAARHARRRPSRGRRDGADLSLLDHRAEERPVGARKNASGFGTRTATVVGVLEPSVPYPAETEIIANVVTSPHHLVGDHGDGPGPSHDGAVRPAGARRDAGAGPRRAAHRPRRHREGTSRSVFAQSGLPDQRGAAARSDHVPRQHRAAGCCWRLRSWSSSSRVRTWPT